MKKKENIWHELIISLFQPATTSTESHSLKWFEPTIILFFHCVKVNYSFLFISYSVLRLCSVWFLGKEQGLKKMAEFSPTHLVKWLKRAPTCTFLCCLNILISHSLSKVRLTNPFLKKKNRNWKNCQNFFNF